MRTVNTILKENAELKGEIEDIISLLKENEIKEKGFKIVEYSFLLSKHLKGVEEIPLKYLEDIFSLDKVYLCLNRDIFDFEDFDNTSYGSVLFYDTNVFKCFFLKKRPYIGDSRVNIISEFDLYDDMKSYLISPIIENDKIVGSLNIYSKNKNKFADINGFDFIKELCFKTAISIRKIYDSEFIKMKSKIDDLTNCYNKTAMYEFLEIFLNRALRYGEDFHFMMLDFDSFKMINDSWGHLEGDRFLKRFGQKMKDVFRKSDIVGRFGGDEFYMIFPVYGQNDIDIVHKKIRQILETLSMEFNLEQLVTASAGCVKVSKEKSFENIFKIINDADNLLYKTKKNRKGTILAK